MDINTSPDVTEDQAEALKHLVQRYRGAFNQVSGLIREPMDNSMRILVPPELEMTLKQKPPHNVSPKGRAAIDKTFDLKTEYGRMAHALFSPYSFQVFVANKDRPVIDMRPLNAITIEDAYPLPCPEDLVSKLRDKSWISTLDITKSFYQRMVHPDDQHRTATVTHRGQELFRVCPMGFKRSPAHQQRFMDELARVNGMSAFMSSYIDDIMVYSDTFDEYIHHL